MRLILARILDRFGGWLIDTGQRCIRRAFRLCDAPIPAEREHIDMTFVPFIPPDVPALEKEFIHRIRDGGA